MASSEFSTWHFLAIFNVSETIISGILPLELKPLNVLKKKTEANILHQKDATTGTSNLPLILRKVETRKSQIVSQSAYQAQCKKIWEIIERQEDGVWEIFSIQLNNNSEELKALNKNSG